MNHRWWADDRDILEGEAEHDVSIVAVAASREHAEMIAAALNVAIKVCQAVGPPGPYPVHILHEGSPLCRFAPPNPSRWPEGHAWVRMGEPGATCAGCLAGG